MVGVHLTDAQMYIFTTSILSVFNIEKVTENGVVQEPKHEFTDGVLMLVYSDRRIFRQMLNHNL